MTSVDINYDFRKDLKFYQKDVDRDSPTLKKYHKKLWEKKLPNGEFFALSDTSIGEYFIFQTNSSKIRLSSDWIINTYLHWNRNTLIKDLKKQINEKDFDNFNDIAHTIGSYIIFPKYPLNTFGKKSINQKRGTDVNIMDRFDLTLECIRRYYLDKKEENPLFDVINDFNDYFQLFKNFEGFCNFYLLQDLTEDNYSKIKFFLKFDGFNINPFPKTVEEYNEYRNNAVEFVNKRNKLILDHIKNNP